MDFGFAHLEVGPIKYPGWIKYPGVKLATLDVLRQNIMSYNQLRMIQITNVPVFLSAVAVFLNEATSEKLSSSLILLDA